MISDRRPVPRVRSRQTRTWAPLLIVAVLYGLVSMHGLGTAPPSEAHPHQGAAAHSAGAPAHAGPTEHAPHRASAYAPHHAAADATGAGPAHGPGVRAAAPDQHAGGCECDGTDGHLSHADPACAATGTSGAPAMDGPAASEAAGPQPAAGVSGCGPRTGGERAPPSLHRLQLLRI